jgi:uncharacterized protein (TIGR03437 family)
MRSTGAQSEPKWDRRFRLSSGLLGRVHTSVNAARISACATNFTTIAALLLLCALSAQAATFGKVVPLLGGSADIVLDETRNQLYLTSSTQNYLQVYSIAKQTFLTPIPTDQTPLSAAMSPNGTNLYVTCYNSQLLDVINLNTLTVTAQVSLPAKPEGVAVGSDGRVLISTTGSGTADLLMIYDPSPTAATALTSISVTLSTPTAPTFPSPSGRPFLSVHSQLRATRDGSLIAGVNIPSTGSPSLFVYQTASGTVTLARIVTGTSTTLAISDDGTRIMCGAVLFDASTLAVLAQQNLANSPYPITPGTSFTSQANQGGVVFSPDNTSLYSVLNIAPVTSSTSASTISQLMIEDTGNLLINMGIQLPENLSGKMVVSADGANAYALSDSGFTTLPLSTLSQSPIAVPASSVALLTSDPCGVTSATSSATVPVNNAGKGSLTATAALLRYSNATAATESSATTAPGVRASGSNLVFSFNSAAASQRGTITPPHDFLVTSTQAVNIPNSVRAYENARDSNARGTIVPLAIGPSATTPLNDLVYDQTRQRVYIANTGLNRVEIYDVNGQAFLTPIKVGQTPTSLALTPDGFTLYVANSGGENISIIDPDTMQVTGQVTYPPVAFNATTALSLPSVIAFGLSGLQIMNSDGSLWKVVGSTAVPRPASVLLGSTLPVKLITPSATVTLTMAATPAGEYILFATSTGIAYLYDATADDFVAEKTIFATTTQSGYIGPVAAGPQGQYYVMGGVLLNSDLTIAGSTTVAGTYSAVAAAGASTYAVFTPVSATSTTPPTVAMVNAKTGNTTNTVNALEGPITQLATTITGPAGPGAPGFGATTRGFVGGRTMAIDAAGTNAYAITASGLSIIPLAGPTQAQMPVPSKGGAVNLASYTASVAPNGLLAIFGQNFGTLATPASTPLPLIMGGTCVTLGNVALPLLLTSPEQINAQIPPGTAAGTYPLVVRSIANLAASSSENVTVAKYAPAVFVDSTGQLALFHASGQYVNTSNPATRDEPLTMYATGLGVTTGGAVTAGNVSPSSPLAVSAPVLVYFGDPGYSQAGVIVDWSGLAPGFIGVYQLNLQIPGTHLDGNALPVTISIGGISSPTTGPAVPYVAVN